MAQPTQQPRSGAPPSFRLILREAGMTREMGGDLTEAVQAVDFLMRKALDLGASDVHLQPEQNRLLVPLQAGEKLYVH